jgi:hypothetical protein
LGKRAAHTTDKAVPQVATIANGCWNERIRVPGSKFVTF